MDKLSEDTVVIRHSLKGAVGFGALCFGFAAAILAMMVYLKNEGVYASIPIPLIVIFLFLFLIMLLVLKNLFHDAGKVAISIGSEGVKFDRYSFIQWSDIEEVYVVKDTDSADCLWLKVKDGVEFLPKSGPKALLWLAKKSGLDRAIDISGYGSLTLSDKEIQGLLEQGLKNFRKAQPPYA
jgi:hypothetical protein